MDVLASMSVETFKVIVLLLAVMVGVLVFFSSRRGNVIGNAIAVTKGLLAAAVGYLVLSVGVVFYILSHATDARWSVGKDTVVKSPELPGNPFFGAIIDSLNSFMSTVTGNVNDLFAIKNAFITTQDFFLMAAWALLPIIPLYVAIRILGWRQEARRMRQIANDSATVKRLKTELREVRMRLGMPVSEED